MATQGIPDTLAVAASRLLATLRADGRQVSELEIMEALWLALYLTGEVHSGGAPLPPRSLRPASPSPSDPREGAEIQLGDEARGGRKRSSGESKSTGLISGTQPGGNAGDRLASPVRVSGANALPDALLIERSLRPLGRRRPSSRRKLLDEEATAKSIAEAREAGTDVVIPRFRQIGRASCRERV